MIDFSRNYFIPSLQWTCRRVLSLALGVGLALLVLFEASVV